MSMRFDWRLSLVLLLPVVLLAQTALATEYDPRDEADRNAYLPLIQPYLPDDADQSAMWSRLLEIAEYYDDELIVERIISLADEADGARSTQYALDLFDLYRRMPRTFSSVADRRHDGDFEPLLSIWINEVGDVTADMIAEAAAADLSRRGYGVAELNRLVETAVAMENRMFGR